MYLNLILVSFAILIADFYLAFSESDNPDITMLINLGYRAIARLPDVGSASTQHFNIEILFVGFSVREIKVFFWFDQLHWHHNSHRPLLRNFLLRFVGVFAD